MLWSRAIIVYLLVVLLIRFLGRDLQFQARPYDQAVQVLLGSAAATLIVTEEIQLWRAFVALGTLAVMHTAVSFLSLWNPVKKFLVGTPDVVIENGQILKANLLKHQISVEELMAGLREKSYHNLDDVEFAMLEASGKLSVIPRSQARPVTPRDLHLETQYEGFTSMLISDGEVNRHGLQKLGLDEAWLGAQIGARGAQSPKDVLFAALDSTGKFFMVRNQDVPFLQAIFTGIQVQTAPGLPPMVASDGHPPH
jgi:uncharacterized membrane protein YcaP (DUF421 family)